MKPETELKLRRAFTLDRYTLDPEPLDRRAALLATTQRTKLGQPMVEAWTFTEAFEPVQGYFTATSDFPKSAAKRAWFDSELAAIQAARIACGWDAAYRLEKLDRRYKVKFNSLMGEMSIGQAAMLANVTEAHTDASDTVRAAAMNGVKVVATMVAKDDAAAEGLAPNPDETLGKIQEVESLDKLFAEPAQTQFEELKKQEAASNVVPMKQPTRPKRNVPKPPSKETIKRQADKIEKASKTAAAKKANTK